MAHDAVEASCRAVDVVGENKASASALAMLRGRTIARIGFGMKNVAVVFPGQGSQFAGMADAVRDEALAKTLFAEASEIVGRDLWEVCADSALLMRSELSQPAILTCSVVAYRILMEEATFQPSLVAGHSMGEITALTCSGALDFGDAIRIVHHRGKLMTDSTDGRMAVVFGIERGPLEKVCAAVSQGDSRVFVANENSREQFVISGEARAVAATCKLIGKTAAVASPLDVFVAAHSPYMKDAATAISLFSSDFSFRDAACSLVSCTRVEAIGTEAEARRALSDQLTSPVEWRRVMEHLVGAGVTLVAECGPKTVLRDLMRLEHPKVETHGVSHRADAARFAMAYGRKTPLVAAGWSDFSALCLSAAVAEENHATDPARGATRVRTAYQRMLQLSEQAPTEEMIRELGELLRQVFKAKKTPDPIVRDRFASIASQTQTEWLLPL